MRTDVAERIESKIERTADGCWLWTKALDSSGYAQLRVDGRKQLAHRLTYEMHVGPIPDGLELDHLCKVRHCIAPDHLEAVSHGENVRRGYWGSRTECVHGHSLAPENTYKGKGSRGRICKTCVRNAGIARRERKRASA